MSYVWTAEQIKRYFDYYQGIATRNTYNYLTFETTHEFARSVLPPCFDVAPVPQVSIASMGFMEVVNGLPNRHGRDRCGLITINAQYGDKIGNYYLTVVETEEVNIETGRELWGMPKKQGVVDFFDDSRTHWCIVERKNHRLIEFEAQLGADQGRQEEADPDYYFEVRGYFGPNGQSLSGVQLVVFQLDSVVNSFREFTEPRVKLGHSDVDPGVATIPLGEFVGGGATGGEMSATLIDVVDLDGDGNDYAPYLLGRLYDDWPDLRDEADRKPSVMQLS